MAKQVKLDENGKRKFSIRDSVAYAAGDLGCNMSFALKGTMALFWTQVMGRDLRGRHRRQAPHPHDHR